MEILINLISLIISLSLLVFLGERLIDASLRLARAFGVSSAVIGLTVLAYGTSLPEFAVSSIASIKQHSGLSVANVIGSNIFNIAIVLGAASIINPIFIKEDILAKRDGVVMLLATALLSLLTYHGNIGRVMGIMMAGSIMFYIYNIVRHDKTHSRIESDKNLSKIKEAVIVAILLVGVLISGNFTVDYAISLARSAGATEWFIGATIVAAGTSLPETIVSIIAARRGEFGMSVGNIAGSNIFNILWILGFASILNPLTINFSKVYLDVIFLNLITILFYLGLLKGRLTKTDGILYIAIYIGYIYYLI
jgi:cation:H+ antiporter